MPNLNLIGTRQGHTRAHGHEGDNTGAHTHRHEEHTPFISMHNAHYMTVVKRKRAHLERLRHSGGLDEWDSRKLKT